MKAFKILIVEDDYSWQIALKNKLNHFTSNGFDNLDIKFIETFDEADQVLKEGSWNLLITDIGLPPNIRQKLGIHLTELARDLQVPTIVNSATEETTRQDVNYLITEQKILGFFSKEEFDRQKFNEIVQNLLNEYKFSRSQSKECLIDFAIITAIEIERKAVCKAFGLTEDNRVKKESRVYWRGRLNLKDGESYEIVVAQLPDMANVDAALLTSDTIHHWHPASMFMVGIAGAASEEEKLGDLILGSSVYYYERGKEKLDGNKPEPYMYPCDATLWSRVTTLPEWTARISVKRPDSIGERPNICQGVIASGERVVADAAVRDEIAAGQRKIRAIEMEGYGFSKATWQSFDQVRHLVIRAICDRADSSKNKEWHSYAAAVAAGFTKHFLLDRPLEPKNRINR
jgi:nucleoside phosphorylase/CheY-like chemotaxis protein